MSALLLCAALAATGNDDYTAREAGSRTLAVLVRTDPARWGPPVAYNAALHPSAEVRARCARLTGPYRAHLADTYTPPTRLFPCIDWAVESGAFADDWHPWFGAAAGDYGPGCCSPGWGQYRRASEGYVRSMIRWGTWSPADADAAIRLAWDAELARFMARDPGQVAAVEAWARRSP